MYKFIKSALVALSACGIASCANENPQAGAPVPTPTPALHQTAMGFTPWPADLNAAGVDRTYDFIHQHANLIAHHFDGGIPWDQALEGSELPKHLRDDWANRKSRTPNDFQTLVAITPLDFGRTDLALAWTHQGDNQPLSEAWSKRQFNEPEVKQAYLSYAERVIAYFQPDYLAIGIEANIMVSKSPADWEDYLELNAHIYQNLKDTHPDLPVFTTVQYEHLRGIEDDAKQHASKQVPYVQQLMEHSDYMALSTYKFGSFHPNPMGPDYFETAERFGKPIAIAEFGAMSSPVTIFGTRLPANENDQARFVSGILNYAARNNVPFAVNWVAIDFDPMIPKLPAPMAEVAKAWMHTGLQRSNGRNKQALTIWNAFLEASRPR